MIVRPRSSGTGTCRPRRSMPGPARGPSARTPCGPGATRIDPGGCPSGPPPALVTRGILAATAIDAAPVEPIAVEPLSQGLDVRALVADGLAIAGVPGFDQPLP